MSEALRIRKRKTRPDDQGAFALTLPPATVELLSPRPGANRAIEDEGFPFEALSHIAELESWRKEVNRPLSHIHKWWAQRLGTVFRAIVLGTFAPAGSNILDLFYAPARIPEAVVFDPFMGSGTTVIEALKLGARAIGRDINPVAFFQVSNALAKHDRATVLATFEAIERDVAPRLRRFYQAELRDGRKAEVLYYFWVKSLPCPSCTTSVDLFGSYIFAKNAYPDRIPEAQALCPHCGEINLTRHDARRVTCCDCGTGFDPQKGPAKGQKAICPCCKNEFSIVKTVRASGQVPKHRLYAKLVLMPDGGKAYIRATPDDLARYTEAETELAARSNAYPVVAISPGENTNQALGYNYRHWHEMFNARQLLALSILGERIGRIEDPAMRDLFMCLMSGALEFNNMFASYKGEGTGAVRHMFYHHILKPERVPLEANLWGTSKSSGSFSTLFESRVMRALAYAENPFELRVIEKNGKAAGEKAFDLSEPIGHIVGRDHTAFAEGARVYLSCGDSSRTDLTAGSVDAVISDPPFFDNVHYSELADFFHVWQRHVLGAAGPLKAITTRASGEVQNADEDTFTARLTAVWSECNRVLKDDGLLVFTYHHSRAEGWSSILKAIMDSGFAVVAAHPIKAEMSGATPKHQAKEPIDLDIIVVCRKRSQVPDRAAIPDLWQTVMDVAAHQVARLRDSGRSLSRNDVRIIVMAQLLCHLSHGDSAAAALRYLENETAESEVAITRLACTTDTLSRGQY
jgi:adenine-specific DNA methylase